MSQLAPESPTASKAAPAIASAPAESARPSLLARKARELFGIDLRSLALFRVGMALVILFDLAYRSASLRAFYTDEGVLPRSQVLAHFSKEALFSLYLATGSAAGVAALFVLAAAAALELLVGYQTRVAAVVSWVLLISLQSRNQQVLQAGDILLRVLVFWSLFLPLGARLSVDGATEDPPRTRDNIYCSVGSFAILMQMVMLYEFSLLFKQHPIWLEGHAVRHAFMLEMYVRPLGAMMLAYPGVMWFMTLATLWLEGVGPLAAFTPFRTGAVRTLVVCVFVLFHILLGVFLDLGIFPFIAIVGWTLFLPGWFWDRLLRRLATPERVGLRIYYDGGCGFCKRTVLIIRSLFLLPQTPLLPAQSEPAMETLMKEHNSWVVVGHDGRPHFKFDAILTAMRASPVIWWLTPLLALSPLRALGTRGYEAIASHRNEADRWTKWLHPRPHGISMAPSSFGSLFAALVLIYVLGWNVRTLGPERFKRWMPAGVDWIGYALRVDQCWNMFAPFPLDTDGWFVVEGQLANGTQVDLWSGQGVTFDKPANVAATYIDQRWRKYLENLGTDKFQDQAENFARWMARDWNERHGQEERVRVVSVIFMKELITLKGKEPPARILKWRQVVAEPKQE